MGAVDFGAPFDECAECLKASECRFAQEWAHSGTVRGACERPEVYHRIQGFSVAELGRLRFLRWLRETGRIA